MNPLQLYSSASYNVHRCDIVCKSLQWNGHCTHKDCDLYCAALRKNCPEGTKYHCARDKKTGEETEVCAVEKYCGKGKKS